MSEGETALARTSRLLGLAPHTRQYRSRRAAMLLLGLLMILATGLRVSGSGGDWLDLVLAVGGAGTALLARPDLLMGRSPRAVVALRVVAVVVLFLAGAWLLFRALAFAYGASF